MGVTDLDAALRGQLSADPTGNVVIFGYSQSGAIVAFEKRSLANDPSINKSQLEFVVIGDVSRPNGGLNGRANGLSIPIVEFPFGPTVPTDTGIKTTASPSNGTSSPTRPCT